MQVGNFAELPPFAFDYAWQIFGIVPYTLSRLSPFQLKLNLQQGPKFCLVCVCMLFISLLRFMNISWYCFLSLPSLLNHSHFKTCHGALTQSKMNKKNIEKHRKGERGKKSIPCLNQICYAVTLPKFNMAPEKLPKPNRKRSSSNHHFLGASC